MERKIGATITLSAILFLTFSFVAKTKAINLAHITDFTQIETTCSKFDGFGACYHNDWERRDKLAAACSGEIDRWSYSYMWGGRCYCYKCIDK
jgi:hypothetical protein